MKRTIFLGIILVLCIACVGSAAAENLVTNGGFETPSYGGLPKNVKVSIPGWTLEKGNIDIIGNSFWQPHAGIQSIDLAGTQSGRIKQTIMTVPGETYTLTFWMAGNPVGNDFGYPNKEMRVYWDGAEPVPALTFDSSSNSKENMGWKLITIPNLRATKTSTEIAFENTGLSPIYGMALDDVSVECRKIPAPEFPGMAMPATILVGFIGMILFVRKYGDN